MLSYLLLLKSLLLSGVAPSLLSYVTWKGPNSAFLSSPAALPKQSEYVTWHAILTSTTHLRFTARAGQSFLNFKSVKVSPQYTPDTQAHTGNSKHAWAMLCSVTRQALTRLTNTHSACICSCCTPCQLNVLVCLHNKCRSKCSSPQCYFFRGVSSLKRCPSHNFTAVGTVSETRGKMCHWDRRLVGSPRVEQGAISSEAEGRGVRHLRQTKPHGKVHTH